MVTKSSSLRVSKILRTTCFAISLRKPVIEPEVSSRMTISLGDAEALMYLKKENWFNTLIWKPGQYQKNEHGMRLILPSNLPISGIKFIKKQIF